MNPRFVYFALIATGVTLLIPAAVSGYGNPYSALWFDVLYEPYDPGRILGAEETPFYPSQRQATYFAVAIPLILLIGFWLWDIYRLIATRFDSDVHRNLGAINHSDERLEETSSTKRHDTRNRWLSIARWVILTMLGGLFSSIVGPPATAALCSVGARFYCPPPMLG